MRFLKPVLALSCVCSVAAVSAPTFAADEAARAAAAAQVRSELAAGGPEAPAPFPQLASNEPLELFAAVPGSSDPIAERLEAVFTLVAPAPDAAGAARIPRPRPAEPVAMDALAYAEPAGKAGRPGGLSAIKALVDKHAEAHDVPPALAHALVKVESSYNPKATGANGEIGLLQISPRTARAIGYKGSPKALYDPETNLTWGMKYLSKAHKLAGGDTCGTLHRYNAGLDATGNRATKFCSKVKAAMAKRA